MEHQEENHYLQLAIDKAHQGMTPFGAVIVQEGKMIAAVYNTVSQCKDPTAHAEVNAIREACQKAGAAKLNDAIIYTTCEPCPMCTAAAIFTGITEVVYGASIPMISQYLPQIMLRSIELLSYSDNKMLIRAVENTDPYEKLLQQYA